MGPPPGLPEEERPEETGGAEEEEDVPRPSPHPIPPMPPSHGRPLLHELLGPGDWSSWVGLSELGDERSAEAWSTVSPISAPQRVPEDPHRPLSPEREFEAFIEIQRCTSTTKLVNTTTTTAALLLASRSSPMHGHMPGPALGGTGGDPSDPTAIGGELQAVPLLLMTRTESAESYGSFASGTFPLSEASFSTEILPASPPLLPGHLPPTRTSSPIIGAEPEGSTTRKEEEAAEAQAAPETKQGPTERTTIPPSDDTWTGCIGRWLHRQARLAQRTWHTYSTTLQRVLGSPGSPAATSERLWLLGSAAAVAGSLLVGRAMLGALFYGV